MRRSSIFLLMILGSTFVVQNSPAADFIGATMLLGETDQSRTGDFTGSDRFARVMANGTTYEHEGCNTVSYGTNPNLGDLMVGRIINGDPLNGACDFDGKDRTQSLTMVRMDWASRKVHFLYKILDTTNAVPIEDGRHTIHSAYDASVAEFKSEYWVAFECAIGITSGCVGPLIWDDSSHRLKLDVTRTSVVVLGVCGPGRLICYAASVPKIATFNDRLFLYWDLLSVDHTGRQRNDWTRDGQKTFIGVDVRGMEIGVNPMTKRMYRLGGADGVPANDDATSIRVISDTDAFQFFQARDKMLAIGAETRRGDVSGTCAMPLNHTPDCYRLTISESRDPLGRNSYTRVFAGPSTGAYVYSHFVYRPDTEETMLVSHVFNRRGSETGEFYSWPERLLEPTCNPIAKPFPNYMPSRAQCLPSCGVLGGHGSREACTSHGLTDAGRAYDVPYCCK